VVFLFDEIEALAVDRGNAHDVGEMRRIASSLLVELDGINSPSLIIGATNRPDLMDAAFRRRFDFVIHFPESTLDANLSLTEKVALKYRFSFVRDSASASLKDVLSKCSPHEVERLVIRAAKHAVISGAESLDLDREVGVTAAAINVFSR
jgi:SpoVK/Ycf46/Vps4 family AAA+-type ATPase